MRQTDIYLRLNGEWSQYFVNFHYFKFLHQQPLDLPGWVSRTQSNSYIPVKGIEAKHIIQKWENIYEEWKDDQGCVYIKYRTDVYLAEPHFNLKL